MITSPLNPPMGYGVYLQPLQPPPGYAYGFSGLVFAQLANVYCRNNLIVTMHYLPQDKKKRCFKLNLSESVSSIQYSTVGVDNSAEIR